MVNLPGLQIKCAYWNIIFFISYPKHMLWLLKKTVPMDDSFEHTKRMFKLMDKKAITILR